MSQPGTGMSSFAKAMLVVMAVIVFFGTILLFAGWIWWKRNQEEIMRSTETARQEGLKAGKGFNEQQCFDTSISRTTDKTRFTDMIANGVYLGACLEKSKKFEGFCTNVPSDTEFARTFQWRKARCKEIKLEQNQCSALLSVVQRYCHEDRKSLGKN